MFILSTAHGSLFAIRCILWQFYAPNARLRLDKNVALINANFRLFRVPLIWLPYATAPAGRRVRQTGFLIPDIGQSSRKGFILGDAFYLAPRPGWTLPLARSAPGRGVLGANFVPPLRILRHIYLFWRRRPRLAQSRWHPQPTRRRTAGVEMQSYFRGWRFVTDYNSALAHFRWLCRQLREAVNSEFAAPFSHQQFSRL
jgi:hypothetical protein